MRKIALVIVIVSAAACARRQEAAPAGTSQVAESSPPIAAQGTSGTADVSYTGPTRTERDLLGEKQVPANAYYGIQTMRALENFQLSGVPINHYPGFVEGLVMVKLAAARANADVGALKPDRLAAIEKAGKANPGRQIPRPVPRRLVPGRRGHIDQHERE